MHSKKKEIPEEGIELTTFPPRKKSAHVETGNLRHETVEIQSNQIERPRAKKPQPEIALTHVPENSENQPVEEVVHLSGSQMRIFQALSISPEALEASYGMSPESDREVAVEYVGMAAGEDMQMAVEHVDLEMQQAEELVNGADEPQMAVEYVDSEIQQAEELVNGAEEPQMAVELVDESHSFGQVASELVNPEKSEETEVEKERFSHRLGG